MARLDEEGQWKKLSLPMFKISGEDVFFCQAHDDGRMPSNKESEDDEK